MKNRLFCCNRVCMQPAEKSTRAPTSLPLAHSRNPECDVEISATGRKVAFRKPERNKIQIMIIILYAYAAAAMIVAFHHGRFILTKLDRYDWHFSKKEIWASFALNVILWPLLLIKPCNLVDPSKMYRGEKFSLPELTRQRDRIAREKDQFRTNPPPCGPLIRYRQGHGGYEEAHGEFLFSASDVERILTNRLKDNPHLEKDDDGAILNWIRNRNESFTEPTDVPEIWSRFKFVANDLVKAGLMETKCLKCGLQLTADQLIANNDSGSIASIVDRIDCPNGHILFQVETMHLTF